MQHVSPSCNGLSYLLQPLRVARPLHQLSFILGHSRDLFPPLQCTPLHRSLPLHHHDYPTRHAPHLGRPRRPNKQAVAVLLYPIRPPHHKHRRGLRTPSTKLRPVPRKPQPVLQAPGSRLLFKGSEEPSTSNSKNHRNGRPTPTTHRKPTKRPRAMSRPPTSDIVAILDRFSFLTWPGEPRPHAGIHITLGFFAVGFGDLLKWPSHSKKLCVSLWFSRPSDPALPPAVMHTLEAAGYKTLQLGMDSSFAVPLVATDAAPILYRPQTPRVDRAHQARAHGQQLQAVAPVADIDHPNNGTRTLWGHAFKLAWSLPKPAIRSSCALIIKLDFKVERDGGSHS